MNVISEKSVIGLQKWMSNRIGGREQESPKKITRKMVESFARSCDRPRTERSVIGCYILNNQPRAL